MASFATNYDFFNYYFVLVVIPMFIVCGLFSPIDTLPDATLNFVEVLPRTHAVALARALVTGIELSQPLVHIAVLAGYAFVSFYMAVAPVRKRLLV